MSGEPVCSREECGKPLPDLAVRYGDPFCSSVCAKLAHGVSLRGSANLPKDPPRVLEPKP